VLTLLLYQGAVGNVHPLEIQLSVPSADKRVAIRRRVLMKALVRLRGKFDEWPLTVKDISSTGMKASAPVKLFPGAQVEIELPNIGWIPGEVVRLEANAIGVRFGLVIDPEQAQVRISGSYHCAPAPPTLVRFV
jgi:hypothetical protein